MPLDTAPAGRYADAGPGGVGTADAHIADSDDAHDASAISFTPAGSIAATNVQDAIEEVASEAGSGAVDVLSNVAADRIIGRITSGSGDSEELTATQVRTLLNVEDGADVTDATNVAAAGAVMEGDAAGGVLAGTYPNPSFAADMATQAELDAHASDTTSVHGITDTTALLDTSDIGTTVQAFDADLSALAAAGNSAVLAASTASFLTADETKLDGIEAGADVTDATNVAAAGAVMGTSFPVVLGVAVTDEATEITAGTGKLTFRMPYAMSLTGVRASLSTASTSGGPFTVDINEGGSTILSTKLTIDDNEKTSTTAAAAAVISDSALADDAEITVDVDAAGSGAKGLKLYLIGTRSV